MGGGGGLSGCGGGGGVSFHSKRRKRQLGVDLYECLKEHLLKVRLAFLLSYTLCYSGQGLYISTGFHSVCRKRAWKWYSFIRFICTGRLALSLCTCAPKRLIIT